MEEGVHSETVSENQKVFKTSNVTTSNGLILKCRRPKTEKHFTHFNAFSYLLLQQLIIFCITLNFPSPLQATALPGNGDQDAPKTHIGFTEDEDDSELSTENGHLDPDEEEEHLRPLRSTDHYLRSLRSAADDHYWRSLRAAGGVDHYLRSLRASEGTTDHYLRSLRSSPTASPDHYWRSLRGPKGQTNHYFRSLRSATDHYLRSLRAPQDHFWRSLRSMPSTNHYFRSLRSPKRTTDHYLRSLRQAPVDHYLRSLRQAGVDHYLRSLRSAPVDHYLRSLRDPPVDHYLRSLRQAPVDHYLRSLRQAPVNHYLRSLREDSGTSDVDMDDEEGIIGSKDVRGGAFSDHMFRSRRSSEDSNKRNDNEDKQENTMPAYWDQSLRTVRF